MTQYPDTQLFIDGPWGPVAAFAPWTFPINQVVRKTSAALAAGCSIIAKGPEGTPASPAALVRTFADAGVPAGVINLVYGDPATIRLPHPASGDPRDHLHGLDASGQEARRNGGRAHEARDAS
jgi:acyl-CoA reductase-like NAD-dependent aldehyde dehydrogenase